MRCLAVIVDIEAPTDIDNVILWDNNGETVATAYLGGQVVMNRPLVAKAFDEAVAEMREAWSIPFGRVARIQEWVQVS